MGKRKSNPIPNKPSRIQETVIPSNGNIVAAKNRRQIWFCISIFIFGFILYGFSIDFGYVLDDNLVNANNKYVMKGIHGIADIIAHGLLSGSLGINDSYRPLLMVHLSIEKELFDLNPSINHFFNVFYYSISSILLFLLLCRLFKKTNILFPFLITTLFMAHPIHTEVVSNIKSRDEILCFLFLIVSIYLLLNYLSSKKIITILISIICYFLALLSKENAITFLAIIPLILHYFTDEKIKRILLLSLPYLGMAILFLIIREIIIHGNVASIDPLYNSLAGIDSTSMRIATCIMILGRYIVLLFYPHSLTWSYSYNEIPAIGWTNVYVICSIIICLMLLIYAIININKRSIFSFGVLYFFITISVTSNIFVMTGAAMAERFLYVPSLGFCIILVFLLAKLFRLNTFTDSINNFTFLYVTICVLLFLYIIKTFDRELDWKDNLSLYSAGIMDSPNSALSHTAFANEYANAALKNPDVNTRKQMLNKAINEFKTGIAIYPKDPISWYNLGFAYYNLGDYNASEAADKKALSFDTTAFAKAYNNIGVIMAQKKEYDSALVYFNNAAIRDSTFIDPLANLARVYHELGNHQNAIKYYNKCIEINPKERSSYEEMIAKEKALIKE